MDKSLEPPSYEVDFSAVICCYFEEQSLDEFYTRLSGALKALGRSYEIIFINDGSTDATFEKLKSIFEASDDVRAVIDLMKNTGQANARTPGLMIARGKGILLLDSDLQLDPEELPLLVEKFDEGYDIVTGLPEGPERLAGPRAALEAGQRHHAQGLEQQPARLRLHLPDLRRATGERLRVRPLQALALGPRDRPGAAHRRGSRQSSPAPLRAVRLDLPEAVRLQHGEHGQPVLAPVPGAGGAVVDARGGARGTGRPWSRSSRSRCCRP